MSEKELEKLIQFKEAEQQTLKKIFPRHKINLCLDYERWDNIIPEKKYLIELKNRDFTYEEFIDENGKYKSRPLIEEDKYFSCILKATELEYKFLYIYYFNCGTYIVWNLSDSRFNPMSFYQTKLLCPKHTFNPNSNKIWKDCLIIPTWIQKIGENTYKAITK
jgi:hypothetical protein